MIATDSSYTTSVWVRQSGCAEAARAAGHEEHHEHVLVARQPFPGVLLRRSHAVEDRGRRRRARSAFARSGPPAAARGIATASSCWRPTRTAASIGCPRSGGEPVAITRPDSAHGETGHRFPYFLPDGRHFLFTSVPPGAGWQVRPVCRFARRWPASVDPARRDRRDLLRSGLAAHDAQQRRWWRNDSMREHGRLLGEPMPLRDAPPGAPVRRRAGDQRVTHRRTRLHDPTFFRTQALLWMDLAGRQTPIPGFADGPLFSGRSSRPTAVARCSTALPTTARASSRWWISNAARCRG